MTAGAPDCVVASNPRGFDLLGQWLGWHPEWPMLLLCAAAWSGIILDAAVPPSDALFCGRGPGLVFVPAEWVVMLAAMMPPLLVPMARRVAFASLWRRRHRALAMFLLGYGLIWSIPAAVGICLKLTMDGSLEPGKAGWAALLTFAAAALWEMTPSKRRALAACHRTIPLRPYGWKANVDCLRLGAIHACSCAATCWLMMIGSMLAPAHMPVMAAVTAIAAMQRYRPRRHNRAEALSLATLGLACAVLS
jgi:hypothetical protein